MILRYLRSSIGQTLKEFGLIIDRLGCGLSYDDRYHTKFSSHKPILSVTTISPILTPSSKVAWSSVLMGSVELEDNVTIGYGSSLKGVAAPIRIGENTIIGDYCVFLPRISQSQMPGSINIGRNVHIGDKSIIKSGIIDDGAYIGHNTLLDDNVMIERDSIVMPGSFVPAGSILKSGVVYHGSPVQILRDANQTDLESVKKERELVKNYYDNLKLGESFIDLQK